MEIKNKIVLVTGATGGIGTAITGVMRKEGAKLILHYNNGKPSGSGFWVKANFSENTEIAKIFREIEGKFGKLDILINTVGIEEGARDQLDAQGWLRTFQVNLFGAVECARHAIKLMDKGVIINISSVAANSGVVIESSLAYSVSKAALQKFSENLAQMLSPKIRVVSLSPGYTMTPIWDIFSDKEKKEALKGVPIGRFINPSEIAEFALEVVKNEAITGVNLTIDGGLKLKSVV
jgi:NAD(P)-dependent dehydrogenase (short-subunit alcohol dehydrogenase family)